MRLLSFSPLKSLPAVEMGGTMYTQSYPLLRLWARQLGKYDGKNDLERYYVDAMTDIASDWRSKCKPKYDLPSIFSGLTKMLVSCRFWVPR